MLSKAKDMNSKVLTIDVGNTKSKLALSDGGVLTSGVRLADHETTVDEALRLARSSGAAGCLVSSVAEGAGEMVAKMRDGGLPTALLTVDMRLPFVIDYVAPRSLGSDRIAGAVGVLASWGRKDALVIDAGTAITYDFLSADGHFRGGAISPGIAMRFRALHAFTAKLPLCGADDYVGNAVGRDTRQAIAAGVMCGIWAEAEHFIGKLREMTPEAIVVVTGGDYKNFDLTAKKGIFASPNLVLQGLAYLAKYNIDAIVGVSKL